ncbi:MAG: MBOAT family protein [Desulfobulbaceae bacterium]|nr:MAG: MBOAT family protein [Desulfobulbaceae bacterium]
MVFSSIIFLFLFLPIVLLSYLIGGQRFKNIILLVASLFFYAWGENIFVLLMLVSISINYILGLLIDKSQKEGGKGIVPLTIAIMANLGLLGGFKYTNFLIANLNQFLGQLGFEPIIIDQVHLPIGISFFTFQALSYVIDLYRKDASVQKNPINIALYISLFPQLIAGPIVRYHDVAKQITSRVTRFEDFYYGVERFIIGLGKKVLIANVLGRTADYIFSLPAEQVPATLAWIGAISYTLQIYYDFSGYSDMAIGLGRMFGFKFLENFNYPYIATSIRDFWRRWHISLSSWFRDYLYIPLGGSRKGAGRTYLNLLLVFFLCGLWHGASWTFVIWGLYHGLFLIIERFAPVKKVFGWLPALVKHCYVILVVIVGWVFFRAETLEHALAYLQAMLSPGRVPFYNSQVFLHINLEFWVVFWIGIICSAPVYRLVVSAFRVCGNKFDNGCSGTIISGGFSIASVGYFSFVFLYSVASLMGGAYNPFLYFRF